MNRDKPQVNDHSDLIGGKLCLDFANTAEWHASEHPEEKLKTYNDIIKWGLLAGIISEGEAKKLVQKAKKNPSGSKEILKRAIELREAIYHIFSTLAKGRLPQKRDMVVLNLNLSRTMAKSRLVQTESGFLWKTSRNNAELDSMLNPIVRSAAELLTSEDWKRAKECADDRGCGYLFLDNSRNRSRRWCSMTDCGNRAKAKRFYKKQQKKRIGIPETEIR